MPARAATVALCLLILTLGGCSRIQLGYEYADWFIARQMSRTLDLDRQQRLEVQNALAAYREQHRLERLPRLLALLDRFEALLAAPDAAGTVALLAAGEQEFRDTLGELLPLLAETMRTLSDEQIDHFRQELLEGRTEYLERTPAMREARALERTEDWTGRLRPGQRQLIAACALSPGIRSDDWLRWREATEVNLLTLLEIDAPPARIERALRDWLIDDAALPDERRQERQRVRAIWHGCVSMLLASLDTRQRERIVRRLDGYRDDVLGLLPDGLQPAG